MFKRELLALISVIHGHIIEFIGYNVSQDNWTASLITEWAERGNVRSQIDHGFTAELNQLTLVSRGGQWLRANQANLHTPRSIKWRGRSTIFTP